MKAPKKLTVGCKAEIVSRSSKHTFPIGTEVVVAYITNGKVVAVVKGLVNTGIVSTQDLKALND